MPRNQALQSFNRARLLEDSVTCKSTSVSKRGSWLVGETGMRRPACSTSKESTLQARVQEGGGVEIQLRPPGRKARPGGLVGWAEGSVFDDDGGTPAELRAGELRLEPPLPQRAQQRLFQKVRQAGQMQVSQGRDHQEHGEEKRDATPLEDPQTIAHRLALEERTHDSAKMNAARCKA